ncbi:MAG: Rid family hydrolase, partial [Candidatus Bathyarchaeota archaeon]
FSFVFTMGAIAPNQPGTENKKLGDIKEQTRMVLENLKQILETARSSLDNVVKTTVFLTNLARDYEGMNEVYGQYFKKPYPARSTIQIGGLIEGSEVEIETIAYIP